MEDMKFNNLTHFGRIVENDYLCIEMELTDGYKYNRNKQ